MIGQRSQNQQNRNTIKASTFGSNENNKSTILSLILVFCIPVLLYLQTVRFGLTSFDDDRIIRNNIEFLSHFENALKAFQTDAFIVKTSQFYRPLQTLSYMTDIRLSGGNNTWMYHLTNVLLLGLIACLLFLLLRRFLIPRKLALLSTLVYCAHPLFVSSIAWIPARGDLLLSLFSFLSFLFLIEYLQNKKFRYLFLHWVAVTLAFFCKETAVFLPFLFIVYYFTFPPEKRFKKNHLLIPTLYVVSGIFWFWLRSKAVGDFSNAIGQDDKVGLMPFLSNLQTIPESLALFFVPVDIAPFQTFSLFKTLTGLAIIVSLSILLFRNKERSGKEKLFCVAWFVLLLLPTMVYKNELIDYLDHRFFLPLTGMLLFVLFIVPAKWFEKGNIRGSGLMLVIFAFLSYFTFTSSRPYADTMTFYNSATAKNPNSPLAFNNRGAAYHNQGLLDKAVSDYTKAIELKPDYATAYNNRGNIYLNQKLNDLAIADFTKAIELKFGSASTYNNRGVAYSRLGLFDKACPDFRKAEELGSTSAKINISRFCKTIRATPN